MFRALRIPALTLLAALAVAGVAWAQAQGRLQATVVDENEQPIEGVQVTVTADIIGFDKELETDKKGRFSIIFVDATIPYDFKFVKDGHQTTTAQFKTDVGGNTRHSFTVPTAGAGPVQPSAEQVAAATGASRNPAVNVFNEGVVAFQSGDRDTAKAKFRQAMERDPSMVDPYSALAGLYLDEKSYPEAEAMAQKILELEPGNVRAMRVLYDVYRGTGDEARAKQMLAELKKLDSGTDTAARVFNEGADAARLGDLDTAASRFREALEVDPELAPAYAALASVYLAQKKYQEALTAADQALELDPGRDEMLKIKYEAYRNLGDQEGVKTTFQEMSTADPAGTAEALFKSGIEMFNSGNTAGAKGAFEQAIQANPEHAKAHYMLGLCHVNSGDSAKAKGEFQRFLELAPDDPDAATAKEMLEYVG